MKKVDPSQLSLAELMEMAGLQAPRRRHDKPYDVNVFEEFKRMAKRFGDPDRLTPAKRRLVRKLCRYAVFATMGQWEKA